MTILLARIYRFFHVLHTNVFPIYSIFLQLNCTTVEKFDQLKHVKSGMLSVFDLIACTHCFLLYSSSRLRTVIKASCGISTEPTIFMRFLPAFCFSSSLRLRVTSPP
jgi:hypothetical protein